MKRYLLGSLLLLFLLVAGGYFVFFAPRTEGKSCLAEARRIGVAPIVREPVVPRSVFQSQQQCEHNTDEICMKLSIELAHKQEPKGSPYAGYDWASAGYIASELRTEPYLDLVKRGDNCRLVGIFREDPYPRAVDDEQSEQMYVCPEKGFYIINHYLANLQDLFVFDRDPCGLNDKAVK